MATGIVSALLSGGIGEAGKGIAAVINSIKGKSPEDAAKLAQMASDLEGMKEKYASDFQLATIQENVALNETAGENIRAEQSNKYSANARPSIIYAWIAIVIYNYIITSLIHRIPVDMPPMFWEVSGVVITGYVFARTSDKLFGGAGGSLKGLGLNIESKGD